MIRFVTYFIAGLVCLLPVQAIAQEEERMPPEFRRVLEEETRALTLPEMKDRNLHEMVEAILMLRLSQALDLSREQILALSERVGIYKDQLHEMKWQIGAARADLRDAVDSGEPDPVISQRLEDCLMQEEAIADLLRKVITESRKDLSAEQAAKFYLFVGDFENEMRELVRRAVKSGAMKQSMEQERVDRALGPPPAIRNKSEAEAAPNR